MQIGVENQLLLACAKIHPGVEELEKINELIPFIKDWNAFSLRMVALGIAPLFYNKWSRLSSVNEIPSVNRERLKGAYYKTLTRSMMLYQAFNQLAGALTTQSIPFIPLKGIYLSEWMYGDIGLRQFSDIDILIHPEDAKKTLLLLESLGFKSVKSIDEQIEENNVDLVHYSPMVLNGVSVEVHIQLLNKAWNPHSILPEKLWESSEFTLLSNQSISVLCLHDMLIHVSLHLNKHMLSGTMQFTGWLDIVNLLEKYTCRDDWNALYERCVLFSCQSIVYSQIVLAKEYMQANVPENIFVENKHLLTNDYRRLFIKYLNGYKGFYNQERGHVSTVIHMKPFKKKVSYLLDIVFPPKLYMVYKYQIRNEQLYLLFYPYRWWLGIKGLINYVF